MYGSCRTRDGVKLETRELVGVTTTAGVLLLWFDYVLNVEIHVLLHYNIHTGIHSST